MASPAASQPLPAPRNMTNSDAPSQTFHLFPRLPPELRAMIWPFTLPEPDDPPCPHLCPFRSPYPSFWNDHFCAAARIRNRTPVLTIAPPTVVRQLYPTTRTNREARAALLSHAIRLGRLESRGSQHRFPLRSFDAERDVVFFRQADLFGLHTEVNMRYMRPDQSLAIDIGTRRIAIHEKALSHASDHRYIRDMVVGLLRFLGVVYVVSDVPSVLLKSREIRIGRGGAWKWNAEIGKFDYRSCGDCDVVCPWKETFNAFLETLEESLAAESIWNFRTELEIREVVVSRE